MRVGVFGGCFNPVHIGHLSLIEEVLTRFELEKVLVVPSSSVDPNYNEINHYTDLPKYTMSKIKHFFEKALVREDQKLLELLDKLQVDVEWDQMMFPNEDRFLEWCDSSV